MPLKIIFNKVVLSINGFSSGSFYIRAAKLPAGAVDVSAHLPSDCVVYFVFFKLILKSAYPRALRTHKIPLLYRIHRNQIYVAV